MSSVIESRTAIEDPWRYGWRYVRQVGPDGEARLKQVPLKKEDLLHPQEDDFIVTTDLHQNVCIYVKSAIGAVIAHRPGYHVLFDVRVDWGVEGVEPHGPDIAAFANVKGWDPGLGTFRVDRLGAHPLAVIEVTSPNTRDNDFGPKVVEYHRARIPVYIIVDLHPENGESTPQLYGYQWAVEAYQPLPLDERGRLKIESLGLWIGVEDGEVVCYGPDRTRLVEYPELFEAAKAAQVQAKAAQAQATAAQAQATAATAAAQNEAAARGVAEARVRDLEAEIERLRAARTNGKDGP